MSRTHAHLVRPEPEIDQRTAALLERMGLAGPRYFCGARAFAGDPAPGTAPPCARCLTLQAMAKRKDERPGPGRPPEIDGEQGAIARAEVRLGPSHVQELEELERELATTRAGAIRWLIERSAERRARRG